MNPLQDLKDIRTPAAIEFWPPAYGWWLLAGLIILSICLLTIWLIKARKVRLAKRQALQALKQIEGSHSDSVSKLNQLLKRVAMTYFPQQNVQEIYGEQWIDFLVKTLPEKRSKDLAGTFGLMQGSLYRSKTLDSAEYNSCQKSVETWIKHALPPSKKTIQQLEQNNA